jgi:hypothetical protein
MLCVDDWAEIRRLRHGPALLERFRHHLDPQPGEALGDTITITVPLTRGTFVRASSSRLTRARWAISGPLSRAKAGHSRCLRGTFRSLKARLDAPWAQPSKLVMRVRFSSPALQ